MISPLRPAESSESSEVVSLPRTAVTPAAAPERSLFALLDDRLCGRWRVALICGVLAGALCAAAGYMLAPVRFSSTGTVHVAPRGVTILNETAATRTLPRSEYETFLRTQARLMKEEGVLARALEHPEVTALAETQRPKTTRALRAGIDVTVERGTELFSVTMTAASAHVAAVLVNAVLDAYEELWGRSPEMRHQEGLAELGRMRRELQTERNASRDALQVFVARSTHGTANLEPLVAVKMARVEALRQELENTDLASSNSQPRRAGDETREPTVQDLEQIDATLADIRVRHQTSQLRLEQLERDFSPQRPVCQAPRRELEVLTALLAARDAAAREHWRATGGRAGPGGQSDLYRERLAVLLTQNEEELRALNRDLSQLEVLKNEASDVEARLADVEVRIRVASAAGGDNEILSGSVTILSRGIESPTPSKDRRKAMAVLGFCAGIGGSLGVFFLCGTINRRAYSARQLRGGNATVRCLGVVPDVRPGLSALDGSSQAAQCVHQIRNRLDTVRNVDDGLVLAVTSPSAGDGKTTLAMALAWSYAAAQHRTIIVDADFVGRSVTRQAGMLDSPGLREALMGRRLDGHVERVLGPNLSVLPSGVDAHIGPEQIRRDDFTCLCSELRRDYDIVVIDTGPLLGSIELLPLVSAATGVVLVLQRGRPRMPLDESIETLVGAGITVLGVVLNRADAADCDRYVSSEGASRVRATHSSSGSDGDSNDAAAELLRELARSCDVEDISP